MSNLLFTPLKVAIAFFISSAGTPPSSATAAAATEFSI
jgi:hypothetical protein